MLILLRHGQSQWNLENRFTGWYDVELSEQGVAEARDAGPKLQAARLLPDVVHCSLQRRAILTATLALDACDRVWIPMKKSWRLNERHYGGLTGLDKQETRERHGDEQVHVWRRSYTTRPPELERSSPYHPANDPRYADLPKELLPSTECLRDVVDRMMPYWYDGIVPDLRAGKTVLVAAHGNSLRALCKHLDHIADEAITELEIPTGKPLVYDLDNDLQPRSRRYLGE